MTAPTQTQKSPWLWVPTLYFAQAIPYVIVMVVSVIVYKRLGISNTEIALYTSWLYLPWVIKPLWSPLVDMFRTKRFWIVSLQLLVGACLACVALTLPAPNFFRYTLALFWLMAFASATHDIAADGFYMLGLAQHQQAAYSGVRNTFYRVATIAGQGLLVMLAGQIESRSGLPPVQLTVAASPGEQSPSWENRPRSGDPGGPLQFVASDTHLRIDTRPLSKAEAEKAIAAAHQANIANGFVAPEEKEEKEEKTKSWWDRGVQGLETVIRRHFGEPERPKVDMAGNLATVALSLSAPPPEGREVVLNLAQTTGDKSIALAEGARLTFTADNWHKPALVVFQLDPKLRTASEAIFTGTSGNTVLAWVISFGLLTLMFLALGAYHHLILPRPAGDVPTADVAAGGFLGEFGRTFASFFRKPGIAATVAFLLLFRFAEAQLVKIASLFLLDSREVGGIGLTTGQLGFVYGTIGVMCLLLGGLLGGYAISRHGLKFWLWPMVCAMNLPNLAYVYLAYSRPEQPAIVSLAVAIEQFGYGFGFSAYMLYMIMVADGPHKTAHYAICTGFMALGMMIPGMFSGWLQELIGYRNFFVWVMLSTIPGFLVSALIRIDPEFGRKRNRPEPSPTQERALPAEALAGDE